MYDDLKEAIVEGKEDEIIDKVNRYLENGAKASEILNDGLTKGMSIVGTKFKSGEYYISDVLMSASAMSKGVSMLEPILKNAKGSEEKKIVLGTVKDDIHDIGKNLVKLMLQGAGFSIIDIGVDVPIEKFVKAVEENNADILGISALLTTSAPRMEEIINAFSEKGIRNKVKVIVGGAPITEEYAKEIGADAFASNAAIAVDVVKKLF